MSSPHCTYARYLAEHRALPVQKSLTGAATNDWEYYQPPLYYLLLAPVYAISRRVNDGRTAPVVRSMRMISIMLWAIQAILLLRLLELLLPADIFIKSGALSLFCFLAVVYVPDRGGQQ